MKKFTIKYYFIIAALLTPHLIYAGSNCPGANNSNQIMPGTTVILDNESKGDITLNFANGTKITIPQYQDKQIKGPAFSAQYLNGQVSGNYVVTRGKEKLANGALNLINGDLVCGGHCSGSYCHAVDGKIWCDDNGYINKCVYSDKFVAVLISQIYS